MVDHLEMRMHLVSEMRMHRHASSKHKSLPGWQCTSVKVLDLTVTLS